MLTFIVVVCYLQLKDGPFFIGAPYSESHSMLLWMCGNQSGGCQGCPSLLCTPERHKSCFHIPGQKFTSVNMNFKLQWWWWHCSSLYTVFSQFVVITLSNGNKLKCPTQNSSYSFPQLKTVRYEGKSVTSVMQYDNKIQVSIFLIFILVL